MAIGVNYYELSERQQALIEQGIEMLKDLIQDDLKSLFANAPFKETYLATMLPPGYYHRYDLVFVKQFYDLVLALAYKFNDSEYLWALNSVAEELAMHAILQQAQVAAQSYREEINLTSFTDSVFKDLDFKILFDPELDGIAYDNELNKKLRLVNLRFKDWFRPFRSNFKVRIGLKN